MKVTFNERMDEHIFTVPSSRWSGHPFSKKTNYKGATLYENENTKK